MFEKEAKEYQEEVISKKDYPHSIALDWQRGAEFGYSKATDEGTSWAHLKSLEKENAILKKALHLYVDWADECGIAWDNFPDMTEKWLKIVEEKGLGWIDGLIFMVTEEAKEQLKKEKSK